MRRIIGICAVATVLAAMTSCGAARRYEQLPTVEEELTQRWAGKEYSDIVQSYGDPDRIEGGGSDLFAQYRHCAGKGCVPKLYQSCGTEDFLYAMNLSVRDRFLAMGCDLTFSQGPGAHDWNFWDREIQSVLDWFLSGREKVSSSVIMG